MYRIIYHLLYFDYTDWAYADKPAPDSIYNKETEVWTRPAPFISTVVVENIVPLTEPVAETPIEEPESNISGGQE